MPLPALITAQIKIQDTPKVVRETTCPTSDSTVVEGPAKKVVTWVTVRARTTASIR